ncbi:hypothetical protein RD792_003685 [Penstemon davidsonii]|uniref:Seipin n=1 Tax=Penstemon davidsonii TaxID=160366 RepID=A0ABR0DFD1_9LAMI|nr:hypothetical protein RD792_003685 [Penstemon davidsonii]
MEEDNYRTIDNYYKLPLFPNPFIFFTNLISLQAEIISSCIISFTSPFFTLISLFFEPFRRPLFSKQDFNSDAAVAPPRNGGGGGSLLLGRIVMGLLGAAYVCMVLVGVMIVAAVLGVGLVRMFLEEPVYVKESLQFDYSVVHPTAVYSFGKRAAVGVPVGHTLYVSLIILMPESDYNRDVGIFQLSAEIISTEGALIERSSHPCMLKFLSWPIRLVRTFLMGVPLLLGITTETQTISFPILKYKETTYPRTEKIRITLIPRAGTLSLPQFYDAEILLKSRPPWTKQLVYSWKWTFYVWTTLYIFLMLVMLLVLFLKPLIFPAITNSFEKYGQDSAVELVSREEPMARVPEEREMSESLRRWQRSRSKRKAALLHRVMPEERCSASSMTVTRGETGFEEGSGDSESVYFGGFD